MEHETYFVDVVLPLALPQLLTYRVPADLLQEATEGKRVVVPLGKAKLYTGLIYSLHTRAPRNYTARYIETVLDSMPILQTNQYQLWEWMANYYGCTLGEVMNAALPSGLKLSSETKISAAQEISPDEELTDKESMLISVLQNRGALSLQELSDALEIKNIQKLISSLQKRNLVFSEEELKEKYKPKIVDYVWLGPRAQTDEQLKEIFDELEKRRSEKQSNTLLAFLQLTSFDQGKKNAIPRLELQEKAKASLSVIQAMVEKNIFTLEAREVDRLGSHLTKGEKAHPLSLAQLKAKEEIETLWKEKQTVLLHGVTSSGKTEVYISLIEEVIAQGKQVLFLLPEIALTTQIIHRLRKHFGKRVGVYHSGYNENERTEVWNHVLAQQPGEYDVVIGARSALFLPFNRLGLVIVDEEHEQSFKQYDPAPRYHARDTAIVLAQQFRCPVLLGSATPSMESYFNATQGRYGLVEMKERFGGISLPEIVCSDIRQDLKQKLMTGSFTSLLIAEIKAALSRKEQIILFQNRRGYSPLWQCTSCAWIPMCTRCDVSLTYHKHAHHLKCHYCGYTTAPPQRCGACGQTDLRMLGFGTEKIEEELQQIIPEIRVQRMDHDTTRSKNSYEKLITAFDNGEIDALVGTQMVTKGLDFNNVSLVGILNADKMMNYPDFRAMERSFQLMTQVAGRAGRRNTQGKVVIQTYQPSHWMFDLVKQADYTAFYEREILERKQFVYPPFIRLVKLVLKHKEEHVVQEAAAHLGLELRKALGDKVMGPEKPYIPRINTYFLQQLLIRLGKGKEAAEQKKHIIDTARNILTSSAFKMVRLVVDVDPL
jgi:primosomal protein N' (replication factor Y) (superfamily II helicase)